MSVVAVALERAEPRSETKAHSVVRDGGVRRFTTAVAVGMGVVAIPYLWVLWDQWTGKVDPLRTVGPSNFYDMQARSMFHGHLWVPNGALGIEAFVHDGRQYTYFGIFPSLLRMPVLLFTNRFDGRLTAPSLLLAWILAGLFTALLLWRLRHFMVGARSLGRAEAASYGVFVAAVTGGSVLMYLAALPWVYNEDFAWSVTLTIGSLFCLLGVMERPSWGRLGASAALVMCAALNRAPTGYACIIAAVLVAVWLLLGRGGDELCRWALPTFAAGVVALVVSCAVTYAKFGLPVGLPMASQVWATVNEHRRYFLAANGGRAFSFGFLPSTLVAYMQPVGVHLSGTFPFISPPGYSAHAEAGAVLDDTYATASVPATMPLLFGLACWGLITAFRPRGVGRVSMTRLLIVAVALGTSGVLLWGYIANRYSADFMPLLVLAGGVGLIDIWRRLHGRSKRSRSIVLVGLSGAALLCILVNVAIALGPGGQWTTAQIRAYIAAQRAYSVTPLPKTVHTGRTLPYWAPAGQLFAVGSCSGLYMSNGESFATVPGQQLQHMSWNPVEQGTGINHTVVLTFDDLSAWRSPVHLLTWSGALLDFRPAGRGLGQLVIFGAGGSPTDWPPITGDPVPVTNHHSITFDVMTDPNLHSIQVSIGGFLSLAHYLAGPGPAVVSPSPPSSPSSKVSVARVRNATASSGPPALCRQLIAAH